MKAFVPAIALIATSTLTISCFGQMNLETRRSVLNVQASGPDGFGSDSDVYESFGLYDNSIFTNVSPGASARQTSSVASGSISYNGRVSSGGNGGGPGQPRSSAVSNIHVIFTVTSSVNWTFAGSLDVFAGSADFLLRNKGTNVMIFSHGFGSPNGAQRTYSGSGVLAAGRYEFLASTDSFDGGFASSSGVFTVIPAPSSLALAGIGALAMGRRRR